MNYVHTRMKSQSSAVRGMAVCTSVHLHRFRFHRLFSYSTHTHAHNFVMSTEDNSESINIDDYVVINTPLDIEMSEAVDVSVAKDGGVLKEILRAAPDEARGPPPDGYVVSVHYVGTLASDGSKFDSSRDRNTPFEFTIGQGQVIRGWDEGVATMKVGEKAMFTIRSDYGYGKSGSPPKIPGDATLKFEVELIDFKEKVKSKWEMSHDERIHQAKVIKEEGTEFFNQKQYDHAAYKYEAAAEYVFDDEEGEFIPDDDKELYVSCRGNAAMCYIKAGLWSEAITSCNRVLKVEGYENNCKALFRRGVANMHRGDLSVAKKDLMAAYDADKSNKDVRLALNQLKEKIEESKKKEKNAFTGFLGKVDMYGDKNATASHK